MSCPTARGPGPYRDFPFRCSSRAGTYSRSRPRGRSFAAGDSYLTDTPDWMGEPTKHPRIQHHLAGAIQQRLPCAFFDVPSRYNHKEAAAK